MTICNSVKTFTLASGTSQRNYCKGPAQDVLYFAAPAPIAWRSLNRWVKIKTKSVCFTTHKSTTVVRKLKIRVSTQSLIISSNISLAKWVTYHFFIPDSQKCQNYTYHTCTTPPCAIDICNLKHFYVTLFDLFRKFMLYHMININFRVCLGTEIFGFEMFWYLFIYFYLLLT